MLNSCLLVVSISQIYSISTLFLSIAECLSLFDSQTICVEPVMIYLYNLSSSKSSNSTWAWIPARCSAIWIGTMYSSSWKYRKCELGWHSYLKAESCGFRPSRNSNHCWAPENNPHTHTHTHTHTHIHKHKSWKAAQVWHIQRWDRFHSGPNFHKPTCKAFQVATYLYYWVNRLRIHQMELNRVVGYFWYSLEQSFTHDQFAVVLGVQPRRHWQLLWWRQKRLIFMLFSVEQTQLITNQSYFF